MGISQDAWHKRRKTGGRRPQPRKKRKHELGRPPSHTKLGSKRIHLVRTFGGCFKKRGLRLEYGNFAWGSEACTRKSRIIDVMYNASNNELLRTKTLVKNAIILVDANPFRQWYEAHYSIPIGRKKGLTEAEQAAFNKKRSNSAQKKYDTRKKTAKIDRSVEDQISQGRLLACISSRPGQTGRCDGYILEGKELEFYQKKVKARKGKE